MIQLSKIKISNFKCFSGEVNLELGKLTLLTGANSTGKSSLMYSVLGALQSPQFPFNYSANGRFVNMGSFSEMVYGHDVSLPMGISFTLDEDDIPITVDTVWTNNEDNEQIVLSKYEAHSNTFDFSIRPKEDGDGTEYLLSLDYRPHHNLARKDHSFDMMLSDLYRVAEIYKNSGKGEDVTKELFAGYEQRTTVEDVLLKVVDKAVSCGENVRATVAFGVVHRLIMDRIKRYKDKMNFISSYRLPGERTYLEESLENGKIHASGKGFVNELLVWREKNRKNYESLISAMRSMGVLYDLEPERIGSGQFKIGVTVHKDGPTALLTDVGFGISQLLPVIVGDIELGDGSTLFTAQPEIHLHPNAQANYADYLVSQLEKKNYVVETHSEYLLNRIRLAIVKGAINENDVRVYYMSQEKDATKVHPIRFTKNGQILGAPKGFFETYMLDVMDIAMEAVGNEA